MADIRQINALLQNFQARAKKALKEGNRQEAARLNEEARQLEPMAQQAIQSAQAQMQAPPGIPTPAGGPQGGPQIPQLPPDENVLNDLFDDTLQAPPIPATQQQDPNAVIQGALQAGPLAAQQDVLQEQGGLVPAPPGQPQQLPQPQNLPGFTAPPINPGRFGVGATAPGRQTFFPQQQQFVNPVEDLPKVQLQQGASGFSVNRPQEDLQTTGAGASRAAELGLKPSAFPEGGPGHKDFKELPELLKGNEGRPAVPQLQDDGPAQVGQDDSSQTAMQVAAGRISEAAQGTGEEDRIAQILGPKPELLSLENVLMMLFFGAPVTLQNYFQQLRDRTQTERKLRAEEAGFGGRAVNQAAEDRAETRLALDIEKGRHGVEQSDIKNKLASVGRRLREISAVEQARGGRLDDNMKAERDELRRQEQILINQSAALGAGSLKRRGL